MRVLYLPTYHEVLPTSTTSSDSIGYGVTSSNALIAALRSSGSDVHVADADRPITRERMPVSFSRSQSAQRVLQNLLDEVMAYRPDVIFIFHTFNTPAALIRKTLLDADIHLPIVGYLHGSHWDPTDLFRFIRYPGLQWLDLANTMALDAALIVSQAFIDQLQQNLSFLPPATHAALCSKLKLVPLPIATHLMDQYADSSQRDRSAPRVTFNHAPIESKRPDLFAQVMSRVMSDFPVTVLFTRRFTAQDFGADTVLALQAKYGERVIFGNDFDIPEYYRSLWASDFQISTATHETLGVATLEAMYTENCCLLPDLPAYREVTGNFRPALYRPNGEALYSAIVAFLQNPFEVRKAAAHLKEASQQYTADHIVERLLPIFEEVTTKHARSTLWT